MNETSKGLKKPLGTDPYDIEVQNDNMDLINELFIDAEEEIGGRTIDDTLVPTTDTGLSVKILLSWLAHMVKSITGKANWRTKPTKNLEELNTALTTHEAENVKQSGGVHGLEIKEGSFPVGVSFGGNSEGVVYGAKTGYYKKIGNVVHWQIRLTITNKGTSAGALEITGLPFAIGLSERATAVGMFQGITLPAGRSGLAVFGSQTKTAFILYASGSKLGYVSLKDTDISDGFGFAAEGTYFV